MRSSVVGCLVLGAAMALVVGTGAVEAAEPAPFATIAEAPTNGNTAASISSDGRFVAFVTSSGGVAVWDAESEVSTVVDADGAQPDVSDDGRWVTYSKLTANGFDVFMWDRQDPASPTNLSNSSEASLHSSITNDGSAVMWRDVPDRGVPSVRVWRRADGQISERQVGGLGLPQINGNGGYVFYRPEVSKIVRWNLQTGLELPLPERVAELTSVSDDGSTVVYQMGDPAGGRIGIAIHTVGQDLDRQQLIPPPGLGVSPPRPVMSGDGSTVVFLAGTDLIPSDTNGSWDLYRWKPGSSELFLVDPLQGSFVLGVSRDGRRSVLGLSTPTGADYVSVLLESSTGPQPVSYCQTSLVDGGLTVGWPAAAGADRYVVRRSANGLPLSWKASVNTNGLVDSAVNPGSAYSYTVEVINASGRSERTGCGEAVMVQELFVPAPESCQSSVTLGNNQRVSWMRARDTADYFIIRRSRNLGPSQWLARVDGFQSSFEAPLPRPGIYSYTIEAVNGSSRSPIVSCGTIDLAPATVDPIAPLSCTARATAPGTYEITWTRAMPDNATDFIIRRSRDGGQFWWAGRVDQSRPAVFLNGNVPSGSDYMYSVESRGILGNSASTVCETVLENVSAVAPTACSLGGFGNQTFAIDWTPAVNDNATVYILLRSREGGQYWWAGRTEAPVPFNHTFYNTVAEKNVNYSYRVEARAADGSSAFVECGTSFFGI